MELVSFFTLLTEPVKFTLAGNISFEAKLVKVARSLDFIVIFPVLSEVMLAIKWLYYFS